ncbi:MAG: STAS domain-containing protein [Actinobacteria bacterium]|nr:STAS domain-containing protein [Actinomycetota bacterium]
MTSQIAITSDNEGSTETLHLAGEFDLAAAPVWYAATKDLLASGARRICVDVGEVTFVDSYGLKLWMLHQRDAAAHGVEVTLTRVPHQVVQVLELAGVVGILMPRGASTSVLTN